MHLHVVVPFLLIGCHTHRCYRSFYEESVVRHRRGSRSRDGNAKPVKKQIKQQIRQTELNRIGKLEKSYDEVIQNAAQRNK